MAKSCVAPFLEKHLHVTHGLLHGLYSFVVSRLHLRLGRRKSSALSCVIVRGPAKDLIEKPAISWVELRSFANVPKSQFVMQAVLSDCRPHLAATRIAVRRMWLYC
jgi:hypothetical protein